MADKLLLPGFGGAYTSESFTSASATGADTLDCSRCASIAAQVNSTGAPGGTWDIEQTFNGSDWSSLRTGVSAADGTVTLLDPTDGPFGRIRLNMANVTAGTNETLIVTIVGFPLAQFN